GDRSVHFGAENDDVAGIGRHKAGHDLHQGRLAATRGAHHRGEFATANAEARALQGEKAAGGAPIGQRDVTDVDGAGHATSPVSSPAEAGDPSRDLASVAPSRLLDAPPSRGMTTGEIYAAAHNFRSAAGGRYWLVKMSSAVGRFLNS